MSNKIIKVMIVGANGVVGRQLTELLTNKGATIVAAIGNRTNIGKDVGELAGIGPIGVPLEKITDIVDVIKRTQPDIAVDCSVPHFIEAYPTIKICAENGVNVISLSEEVYYAQVVDQKMVNELNEIATKNGASIIGLGVQDVNWNALCTALAANCYSIKSIRGEDWCIIDFFASSAKDICGAGLSKEEFENKYGGAELPRNAFSYGLYQIADEMGLTVKEEINTMEFIPTKSDYYVEMLDETIPKGYAAGSCTTTELLTEEGISLKGSFYALYGEEGIKPINYWAIEGEPNIDILTEDKHGEVTTAYDIVNRLTDVINARPGFLTVKDLPKAMFKVKPLPEYLKD